MDPSQPPYHESLPAHLPPSTASLPLRTASSTPVSSPGLFSPSVSRHVQPTSVSESNTPAPASDSPYLHPLQTHRVRETHKALIDSDQITGRKSINQYEVIEEIGRGMHGKVKLARNSQSGENVAIKIIPRFSKKRRLGRVTAMSPQDKTKKEIAILKKIRHPNVVALLEVIDDPELKKIYMVLEHVELGEIVWRKKGLPHICLYERRRVEREIRGEVSTPEEEVYEQMLERRQALRELKRARLAQHYAEPYAWSNEYGAAVSEGSSVGQWSRISSREDMAVSDPQPSPAGSRCSSQVQSFSASLGSGGQAAAELADSLESAGDVETPVPQSDAEAGILAGPMFGGGAQGGFRTRSPSMADSIISHMSSVDYNPRAHDPFAEDFSFVPCFTLDQARSTFRDTVLGLEYLHYQGVVHRDIKPANLLWTKDHRVKISDFGVSYFGRPIRDGELDDTVSESEAKDFDDDLELAKTVGTPAFFAPELCYTDLEKEDQPKVSEQIDVWSLGVTLYCLIYARIPFLAEDEFHMFRKIATEEVHISRKRLKPVDPSTSPSATSLYKRQNAHPYRDDNDLEYEEVDNLLYDLLRQMLIKNPDSRIRLRDIKRHPWVVQDLANPGLWIDETDPARPSCGRRIQVDEKDMSFAVVPLNFLERARSVVKKAVGKVMHPLADRSESRSRRRAVSSAASSAGDSVFRQTGPPTNYTGDRRGSLRFEDYFSTANKNDCSAMVSSSSSLASCLQPEPVEYDPLATVLPPVARPFETGPGDASEAGHGAGRSSGHWPFHRHHGHAKGPSNLFDLKMPRFEAAYGSAMARHTGHSDDQRNRERDGHLGPACQGQSDGSSRSVSVDRALERGLFVSADKRAHAQVALSNATAPGDIQGPREARAMRSVDLGRGRYMRSNTPSPLSNSPQVASAAYQHGQPQSEPNLKTPPHAWVEDRPQTAHRVDRLWVGDKQYSRRSRAPSSPGIYPVLSTTCPGSLGERRHGSGPARADADATVQSLSLESVEAESAPLASASEATSPVMIQMAAKKPSQTGSNFQSDPSLPALLSGASSVSADMEGELLSKPGRVKGQSPGLESIDSMTPPALSKEPSDGFPLDSMFGNPLAMESGTLALHLESGNDGAIESPALEDDDDGENDDGILLMAKPRKRFSLMNPWGSSSRPLETRRRDTGTSTASTETARKPPGHDV
ncbi:hypothetical protein CDD82_711 [Ophiocordyceps australis]|uniref:non-specific serine/threonine protein kinase n=1 Tax=Ophiocordyceps australis TaxID=1399860 RepID=A0A2C5XQP5_9HYPO|nr:hypothetical protein CDD82_711 [Ophiocordyceps australis]